MKKKMLLICLTILVLTVLSSCKDSRLATVEFNSNGGTGVETVQAKVGSMIPRPSEPKRTGYKFDGWYFEGNEWVFTSDCVPEDITLEAKWTPIKYTITYVGAIKKGQDSYTIEDEFDLRNGVLDYYDFYGWYMDEELTVPIEKIKKGTQGNLTLYAKVEYNYSDFEFSWNGYGYRVDEYLGTSKNVVIPSTYKGQDVVEIDKYAFVQQSYLEAVYIPDTVRKIGLRAFEGCFNLTSVDGCRGLISIDEYAFARCTNLKSIQLCDGLNEIGDDAFEKCKALESIDIPDSVTSLGMGVFGECSKLKSVRLPSNINEIPNGLFYRCTELDNVKIPQSVTHIGLKAFCLCTGLKKISLPSALVNIDSSALSGCDSLEYNLYDKGCYLGNEENPYLFLKTISNRRTGAIKINEHTKIIGDGAFYECIYLTNIEIPNSVTIMGSNVFDYCFMLESIKLSDNTVMVGDNSFNNCMSLKFNEYGNATYIGSKSNPYLLLVKAKSKDIGYCKINRRTVIIGSEAFADCTNIDEIKIPKKVNLIKHSAFNGCENVRSIKLSRGLLIIEERAFANCNRVREVNIPNTAIMIGSGAFASCEALSRLTIPKSVIYVGERAVNEKTYSVIIYCEAEEQPNEWNEYWKNNQRCIWGYKENIIIVITNWVEKLLTLA